MTVTNSLLEEEQAKKIVDRFVRRFDESYRLLIYYAAIPLILTPELLNYLRHQFLRGRVNWVAEVDLLLSDLFNPVGYELYAMDTAVRAYLLQNIEDFFQKQELDQQHFKEVAIILLGYIKYLKRTNSYLGDAELQAQQWAAMVYIEDKKEQVFQEITQAFQDCISEPELARLAQITQELSPQLKNYPTLIQFAEKVRDVLLDIAPDLTETQEAIQLSQTLAIDLSNFRRFSGTFEDSSLKSFSFETVTVDRRGKTIKTETKQAQYFTEILPNNITLEMVAIPDGAFMMGSQSREKASQDDERPQHLVTVPPFLMGKYPITQEQWKAIAENTPKIERDLKPNPSSFKWDNRPVERVSWLDAVEFCLRLSKLTGKAYRLPTEAEWEYACRAGTTTPFYFGETITSELANFDGNYTYADEPKGENRNKTTPVGQFPPNAFGLYDMHGNVWEWCFDDWNDNYEGAPANGAPWIRDPYTQYIWDNLDSKGLNKGNIEINTQNRHLLRGGSWILEPFNCRCAYRVHSTRDSLDSSIGFRVLCRVGRTP